MNLVITINVERLTISFTDIYHILVNFFKQNLKEEGEWLCLGKFLLNNRVKNGYVFLKIFNQVSFSGIHEIL